MKDMILIWETAVIVAGMTLFVLANIAQSHRLLPL